MTSLLFAIITVERDSKKEVLRWWRSIILFEEIYNMKITEVFKGKTLVIVSDRIPRLPIADVT